MPRDSPLTLNQSLMPRDAWPSAMASRLAGESSSKPMCGSTLSGTVSTHVRAREHVAVARPHLDAVAARPTDCTGVESHCANGGLRGHRVDQAARARPERVDAAGLLR